MKGPLVQKPWPVARVERHLIANLQAECDDFGGYYQYIQSDGTEAKKRTALLEYLGRRPRAARDLHPDGMLKHMDKFRLIDGLLYRSVWTRDGAELRICAPTGCLREAYCLVDTREVPFRKELMLLYHNSLFGGHIGREQTLD